ncbi:DNA primase, partial [Streptococcus agalactiae]
TDCPPLQELETKADWNDIVKYQNNYSLKDVIQSAKLQVIRSNLPPRKNTALEL